MMAQPTTGHAWRLGELLAGFADPGPAGEIQVASLALDSRAIVPGSLFLAVQGGRAHGLVFAEEAWRCGATSIVAEPTEEWTPRAMADLASRFGLPIIPVVSLANRISAIADRFFGEPSAGMEVFGITGTNGKTSISHYLAQALAAELRCGIVGTLGNGFPGALRDATHTTPDAVTLQATLADLRSRGARAVAMEVSSHALDQSRAAAVRFSHAVFTNLSRDHLDYHGDMAAYGEAKRRLFLMPGLRLGDPESGRPFLRRDNRRCRPRGLHRRLWAASGCADPAALRALGASLRGRATSEGSANRNRKQRRRRFARGCVGR